MAPETLIIVVSLLFGGGGILTGVKAWRKLRSETHLTEATAEKTEADTTEVIGKAWAQLFVQLQTQINEMKAEISRLQDEQAAKNLRIQELEDQSAAKDVKIACLEEQVVRLTFQLSKVRMSGGMDETRPREEV